MDILFLPSAITRDPYSIMIGFVFTGPCDESFTGALVWLEAATESPFKSDKVEVYLGAEAALAVLGRDDISTKSRRFIIY